jgi:hypothetical protein
MRFSNFINFFQTCVQVAYVLRYSFKYLTNFQHIKNLLNHNTRNS